jgi:hypothetical protein
LAWKKSATPRASVRRASANAWRSHARLAASRAAHSASAAAVRPRLSLDPTTWSVANTTPLIVQRTFSR